MYYFDTSAIVKLMFQEEHSIVLRKWLQNNTTPIVSNDLARTELLRTVRKRSPENIPTANQILDNFVLLKITTKTYTSAGLLEPTHLRSLDALHLASMLELGEELAGLFCYDQRRIDSAQLHNIPTVTP